METIYIKSIEKWREWLASNHAKVPEGIWLVYYKNGTKKPSLIYNETVEEALCYGWIDSIIKKIDEESYCRKFTPRKPNSKWSALNKKRAEALIQQKRMTKHGMCKIDEAKRQGIWDTAQDRPVVSFEMPVEFAQALKDNLVAKKFFDSLPQSACKQFIGWITTAKRESTKKNRINESIELLKQGRRLGLK